MRLIAPYFFFWTVGLDRFDRAAFFLGPSVRSQAYVSGGER